MYVGGHKRPASLYSERQWARVGEKKRERDISTEWNRGSGSFDRERKLVRGTYSGSPWSEGQGRRVDMLVYRVIAIVIVVYLWFNYSIALRKNTQHNVAVVNLSCVIDTC